MKHLEIDNLDRLPPEAPMPGRTPPWAMGRARADWRVTTARGVVGLLALLLGYWLVGDDIREWLRWGDGAWVVKALVLIGLAYLVKRYLLFDRVRGLPLATARLARLDATMVIRDMLGVDREYAGAVVPAQLTYSPHHDRHYAAPEQDGASDARPELPAAPPIQVLPHVAAPLLVDWRERKLICQSTSSLLLGFDRRIGAIEPSSGVYLTMGAQSDVALLAVSGDSGSGKTSTLRFLLAQCAMNGAALILCDPHGRKNQQSLVQSCGPLAESFLIPPAIAWNEIHDAVATVDRIGRNRLGGADDTTPIVLVLDEFNDTATNMPDFKIVANLLNNIGRSYRKTGITCFLVVHNWRVNTWKDGTLKDATQGVIFHRMSKSEAKLFVADPAISQQIAFLPAGDALYFRRGQPAPARLTGIPYVTRGTLEEARHLFVSAPPTLASLHLADQRTDADGGADGAADALLERTGASADASASEGATASVEALYESVGARAGADGRTDGHGAPPDIPEQLRVRLYLQAYASAGLTREQARERLGAIGLGFENADWTRARSDLGLN